MEARMNGEKSKGHFWRQEDASLKTMSELKCVTNKHPQTQNALRRLRSGE